MGKTKQRARKHAAASNRPSEAPQKKSLKQAVKKAGEQLTAAFKRGDWLAAEAVLESMRQQNLTPTTLLCNKVLSCLCKNDQLSRAKVLFRQMCGLADSQGVCSGVPPSPVTYATMIKAYGDAGLHGEAHNALVAMQASGVPVDTVCWNTAISSCASEGTAAPPLALDLLKQAEAAHAADVVTYNATLAVLQKAGDSAAARALLKRLSSGTGSIKPNAVTYATVIAACAVAREHAEALAVLRDMQASCGHASTRAFNAALAACERSGRWREALALLREMEHDGPPPDAVSVRSALLSCCAAAPGPPRLAEAKALFKRVEAGAVVGVPRTAVSHNFLVRACNVDVVGDLATQESLLAAFLSPSTTPDCGAAEGTLAGPGGLEVMQEVSQPVTRESSFRGEPFPWPAVDSSKALEEPAAPSRERVTLVACEKAFQRRPRNRYDLNVWALAPNTFPPPPPHLPPVRKAPVSGVTGAFLLSGVLSPAQCRYAIAAAEAMGFSPDEPLARGSGAIGGAEARIDGCVWLATADLLSAIFSRCEPHLPTCADGSVAAGINARWRLFRYGEQAVYRPHVDGSWPGSGVRDGKLLFDAHGDRWSQFTFLIYLNDDFNGGCTTFFSGTADGSLHAKRVLPQQGAALVFPHGVNNPDSPVHEGSKVSNGTKYVIRTDVLYYCRPRSQAKSR